MYTHDRSADADSTPLMIQAAGFPLPELYYEVMGQSWSGVGPWSFLRGETFLRHYRELNAALARLHERAPTRTQARVVLPFAVCNESRAVACIQVVPESRDVLLINAHMAELQILAILPTFAAWLRLALEDLIRLTADSFPEAEGPEAPSEPKPSPSEMAFPGSAESSAEAESPADSRSTTRKHLMKVLRESEVDLDFVSAEAADEPITSASVRRHHERVKRERGEQIYADMLFVLTQHRYPDRMAKWLWGKIRQHQTTLERRLGRPVEVTVASLDFLNQNEHLVEGSLVLCSEDEMTQVADVALRDGLTGLFDQATFRARVERELERARRYEVRPSLLMLDLDHFKRLNDEHGHLEGDQVLASMGQILRKGLRTVDVAARYGGEEFAVLLPQTGLAEAELLAERLRRSVEDAFAGELGVTVSIGVASYLGDGRGVDALIDAADKALYRSKELGRNRTTVAADMATGRQDS